MYTVSVCRRASGKGWRAVARYKDEDGWHNTTKSLRDARNKAAAIRMARAWAIELNGSSAATGPVVAYVADYIDRKAALHSIQPSTATDYRKSLNGWRPYLDGLDLRDLAPRMLADALQDMMLGSSPTTVLKRYVLLKSVLDSAVMVPNTTQGGAYTISRIAPRTVPYVQWGNDDDRLFGLVISDEFLTPDERADLLAEWSKAVAGEGTYDPAAYLTGKGHTLQSDYKLTFATAPVTLDWLNTSSQSDTEITVNCVDGLVQYNNLNQLCPAMAESWEVSDDGSVYTFHIREGAKWFTSEGEEYADVTAGDFVAGFHHMLA